METITHVAEFTYSNLIETGDIVKAWDNGNMCAYRVVDVQGNHAAMIELEDAIDDIPQVTLCDRDAAKAWAKTWGWKFAKNSAAVALGSIKTTKKAATSAANGAKGGRPRKSA